MEPLQRWLRRPDAATEAARRATAEAAADAAEARHRAETQAAAAARGRFAALDVAADDGSAPSKKSKKGKGKLCRYGGACTRADCAFVHPPPAVDGGGKSPAASRPLQPSLPPPPAPHTPPPEPAPPPPLLPLPHPGDAVPPARLAELLQLAKRGDASAGGAFDLWGVSNSERFALALEWLSILRDDSREALRADTAAYEAACREVDEAHDDVKLGACLRPKKGFPKTLRTHTP